MGHWALGIGHWALGIGQTGNFFPIPHFQKLHPASGVEFFINDE
jgi:hypothetical protein